MSKRPLAGEYLDHSQELLRRAKDRYVITELAKKLKEIEKLTHEIEKLELYDVDFTKINLDSDIDRTYEAEYKT